MKLRIQQIVLIANCPQLKREVIYYKIYQWENRIKQNKVKNVNKKTKQRT
jgi:hypothetical protein